MRYEELDALPDVTPSITTESRIINDQRVNVPVQGGPAAVLYQTKDDGIYHDREGWPWLVGWLDGKRVKCRGTAL
jgi:hypothetical protein